MSEQTRQRSGLTAITIENFKGIGAPVTVPLKPITLLFGANSAGKSTVIQALQYAWEVLENRNPDVDRTRLGGEVIDLGGFRNLVHRHDLSRQIRIGLEYEGEIDLDAYVALTVDSEYFEALDVRQFFDIEKARVQIATSWDTRACQAFVASYEVYYGDEIFGRIEHEPNERPRININVFHKFFRQGKWMNAKSYWESIMETIARFHPEFRDDVSRLWSMNYPEKQQQKDEIFARFAELAESSVTNTMTGHWSSPETVPRVDSVIPEWGRFLGIDVGQEYRVDWSDASDWAVSQLVVGAGDTVRSILERLRYLGPLRELPGRAFHAPLQSRQSRWANGLGAWDALLHSGQPEIARPSLVDRCSHYLHDVLGLGYTIRKEDRIQLPSDSQILTDLRMIAARYEEREGSELRQRVLEPLENLPRISVVQLRDERNDIDVSPMDIGVGVSQTLPVVVGAVEPNCSVFAVEQPELHIHPRVQVNLADVFLIEFLGQDKQERIALVETHSEHLVLRIMRRMRQTHEGNLPPGIPPVRPEDVAVLYVEIVDGTTYIREMPLNARGELVKAWPGGFFEEALEETL